MDRINNSEPEEISVQDILLKYQRAFRFLKSKSLIILICGIVGAAVGFGYATLKKATYTASCTFVLDGGGSGGGLSQLAGLASFAGLDIGINGGMFEGDNIMELYKSRNMIKQALLSRTSASDGKNTLLIDRYINVLKLRERWDKKPDLKNVSFDTDPTKFNRIQDSILTDITGNIANKLLVISRPDKKLNIVKVDITFNDELFAKEFNDKLVETVNDFYVKTKTQKTQKNVDILESQVDSVRGVLNQSLGKVAISRDATPNANPLQSILNVPSQRKQVDVQSSSAIYAELVKNLELAKISLRQEVPLIQVIDEPIYPLLKNSRHRLMFMALGFFLMALLSAFGLLIL